MFVHPDDVNLPDIKAMAAERGVNIVASTVVPRGAALFARPPKDWL